MSPAATRSDAPRPTRRRSQSAIDQSATYSHPSGRSPRPIIANQRTFQFEQRSVAKRVGSGSGRAAKHLDYILRDDAVAHADKQALLCEDDSKALAALDAESTWIMDAGAEHLDELDLVMQPSDKQNASSSFIAQDEVTDFRTLENSKALARSAAPGDVRSVFDDTRMAWTNIAGSRTELGRFWREVEANERTPAFDKLTLQPTRSSLWKWVSINPGAPAELRTPLLAGLQNSEVLDAPLIIKTANARKLMGWLLEYVPKKFRGLDRQLPVTRQDGRGGRIQHRIIAEIPWQIARSDDHKAIERTVHSFAERFQTQAGQTLPWVAAVHRPTGHNDPRNWHLHFVYHDRPIGVVDAAKQNKVEAVSARDWIPELRKAWAKECNAALEERGEKIRFWPARTEQLALSAGVDPTWLPPRQTKLPPAAAALDRRGAATREGLRAGVGAIAAAHLRADRRTSREMAGLEQASVTLSGLQSLHTNEGLKATNDWQRAFVRFSDARRAEAINTAHSRALAKTAVAAGKYWQSELAKGQSTLKGIRRTSRNANALVSVKSPMPDIIVRPKETILAIAAANKAIVRVSSKVIALDRAREHTTKRARGAARMATAAWEKLRALAGNDAMTDVARSYVRAARNEQAITEARPSLRAMDRAADGLLIRRKAASAVAPTTVYAQFHTSAAMQRHERISRVAAGRLRRDIAATERAGKLLVNGRTFANLRPPKAMSALVQSGWELVSNGPDVRQVGIMAAARIRSTFTEGRQASVVGVQPAEAVATQTAAAPSSTSPGTFEAINGLTGQQRLIAQLNRTAVPYRNWLLAHEIDRLPKTRVQPNALGITPVLQPVAVAPQQRLINQINQAAAPYRNWLAANEVHHLPTRSLEPAGVSVTEQQKQQAVNRANLTTLEEIWLRIGGSDASQLGQLRAANRKKRAFEDAAVEKQIAVLSALIASMPETPKGMVTPSAAEHAAGVMLKLSLRVERLARVERAFKANQDTPSERRAEAAFRRSVAGRVERSYTEAIFEWSRTAPHAHYWASPGSKARLNSYELVQAAGVEETRRWRFAVSLASQRGNERAVAVGMIAEPFRSEYINALKLHNPGWVDGKRADIERTRVRTLSREFDPD